MRYIFAWDPIKAKDNLRNHRISFERAATIFHDPQALSIFDIAHSHEEDRWITLVWTAAAVFSSWCIPFTRSTPCRVRYVSSQPGEPLPKKQGNIKRGKHEARI